MVEGVAVEQEAPEETGDPIKDMDNYRNHHGMDRVFQYLLQVSPPALPPPATVGLACPLFSPVASERTAAGYGSGTARSRITDTLSADADNGGTRRPRCGASCQGGVVAHEFRGAPAKARQPAVPGQDLNTAGPNRDGGLTLVGRAVLDGTESITLI
jgi:hypothetical protein